MFVRGGSRRDERVTPGGRLRCTRGRHTRSGGPPDRCERVTQSSAVTAARAGEAAFWGIIRPFRPVRHGAEAPTRDSTAHEVQFSAAGRPNVRDRRGEGALAAAPTVCVPHEEGLRHGRSSGSECGPERGARIGGPGPVDEA